MKFRVEHTFRDVSLADYEELYFDEPFGIALCKAVKLRRTLEKRELKNGRMVRIVRVGPDRDIPPTVAKILGTSRIEYTEHVDYRMGSFHGTWKTVSSVFTEKVDAHGTFGFAEKDEAVVRVVEGSVDVKIFGLGGVLERFIVADVERSYNDAAHFTQRWIDSDGKP